VISGLRLHLVPKPRHFPGQRALSDRAGERPIEIRASKRLADEVGRTQLHRVDHRVGAPLARKDDHRHVAVDPLERGQRAKTVEETFHGDVQDHRRRTVRLVAPHRFRSIGDDHRCEAPLVQELTQLQTRRGIVVHDENLRLERRLIEIHVSLHVGQAAAGEAR
jgi:hypothetical protein